MASIEEFLQTQRGVVELTQHGAGSALLLFEFADVRFAVPVSDVEAMTSFDKAAPVPGAPATLLGLVQLRGKIVAVTTDPLGLSPRMGRPQRLIVCHRDGYYVGLPVDTTVGIAESSVYGGTEGTVLADGVVATLVDVGRLSARLRGQ